MLGQEFYDINQSRNYPFDDNVTLLTESGEKFPEGLLCDVSCVMDSAIARRVFISGATKRGDFISLIFSADNEERTTLGLLSGSLRADAFEFSPEDTPSRHIKPLVNNFYGTAVFGNRWNLLDDGVWRVIDPKSTLLAARCCFPLPVPGLQTAAVSYSSNALQSIVDLQEEGDIELKIEERVLGGRSRKALVIGLSQSSSDTLGRYAGEFQQRPEARSCGDPQPVETINGVEADCCGRVFLEFRGCAEPIPISNHCGIVIECPLTLADICPPEIDYGESDNPDKCLFEGGDNLLRPAETQPGRPTLPPEY